jgi:hypothetical protein
MGKMYYGNIDVSKIDKTKLYKGEKGTYLSVVVWINDEPDAYGNSASVQVGQSKEDREAGIKATYLGNLKSPDAKPVAQQEETEEELPFN